MLLSCETLSKIIHYPASKSAQYKILAKFVIFTTFKPCCFLNFLSLISYKKVFLWNRKCVITKKLQNLDIIVIHCRLNEITILPVQGPSLKDTFSLCSSAHAVCEYENRVVIYSLFAWYISASPIKYCPSGTDHRPNWCWWSLRNSQYSIWQTVEKLWVLDASGGFLKRIESYL